MKLRLTLVGAALALVCPAVIENAVAQDPPEGLSRDDTAKVRVQQSVLSELDASYRELEEQRLRARTRQECDVWRRDANAFFYSSNNSLIPPDLRRSLTDRANALAARPCPAPPDPRQQTTAPSTQAELNPELDDIDEIVDDPDAGLGAQGLAPVRPQTQAVTPPSPEADDLDEIVDNPDAGLGAQGLAPDAPPPAQPSPMQSEPQPEPPAPAQIQLSPFAINAPGQNIGAITGPSAIFNRTGRLQSELDAARRRGDCARSLQLAEEIRDELEGFASPRYLETIEALERAERRLDANDMRHNRDVAIERLAELDRALAQPCPPVSPPAQVGSTPPRDIFEETRALAVSLGNGQLDFPDTGIGVMRAGPPGAADEEFAGRTPDKVDFVSVEGFFEFIAGRMPIRLGGGYAEGSRRSTFAVAEGGGIDSGIVYGAPAPSGASGIIAPFGLSGENAVDLNELFFRVDLNRRALTPFAAAPAKPRVRPSAYVEYRRAERDYTGVAGSSGTTPGGFAFDFRQERRQDLDESYYEAGLGLDFQTLLARGLAARVHASGGAYHGSFDLESVERNRSNFGPVDDQDFTVDLRDSENGWGVHGAAAAELALAVSSRVALTFAGSADYRSKVGAIFNLNSGDQSFVEGLTTALETADSWSWRIGVGLVVALGARSSE